LHHSLPLV